MAPLAKGAFALVQALSWFYHYFTMTHGPEQIHLSYGSSAEEMTVVWSTSSDLESSWVLYGLAPYNYSTAVTGRTATLTNGNPYGLQLIHRAVMKVCWLSLLAQTISCTLSACTVNWFSRNYKPFCFWLFAMLVVVSTLVYP